MRSANLLKRLDWFRQLKLVNLHATGVIAQYGLDEAKAMQRIQVRRKDGVMIEGMRGITYISLFLPLLWLFVPLMQLSLQFGFGGALYDWVAKNRLLFPVPGYCPIDED